MAKVFLNLSEEFTKETLIMIHLMEKDKFRNQMEQYIQENSKRVKEMDTALDFTEMEINLTDIGLTI